MNDRTYRKSVGERVRRRRQELGLSQAELAARSGLSGKFVGEVERGGNPTVQALVALAGALGVHPKALLEENEDPGTFLLTMDQLRSIEDALSALQSILPPVKRMKAT